MGMPALLRACREMLDAHEREDYDEAEIVGTPKEFWLGDRRIKNKTVTLGLMFFLFHSEGVGTEYEIHTLNQSGREYAKTGVIPEMPR